jgi:hypothetical protein
MDLVSSVRAALDDVTYPVSKEQLVEHVERKGSAEEAVRALRALPLADYRNEGDVLRSIPTDTAALEGQTPEVKANQARQQSRSGLAEHMRDTQRSPIEEELGENRGS